MLIKIYCIRIIVNTTDTFKGMCFLPREYIISYWIKVDLF